MKPPSRANKDGSSAKAAAKASISAR